MGEGAIEIDSIEPIGFPDITPELARESGFLGVLDLLKVAKHGRSEKIYLVRFHYVRPRGKNCAWPFKMRAFSVSFTLSDHSPFSKVPPSKMPSVRGNM